MKLTIWQDAEPFIAPNGLLRGSMSKRLGSFPYRDDSVFLVVAVTRFGAANLLKAGRYWFPWTWVNHLVLL